MERIAKYFLHLNLLLLGLIASFSACSTSQAPDFRAAVADPDRPASERELDAARKPAEVLAFYDVKSGDKVADLWAGRGYYTAILSQVVGASGVVYTVNPNSRDEINQRWKSPKFSNIKVADGPFDKLALPQDASLDFVLIHLNYHDVAPEVRGADEQTDSRVPQARRSLCGGRSFGERRFWKRSESRRCIASTNRKSSKKSLTRVSSSPKKETCCASLRTRVTST